MLRNLFIETSTPVYIYIQCLARYYLLYTYRRHSLLQKREEETAVVVVVVVVVVLLYIQCAGSRVFQPARLDAEACAQLQISGLMYRRAQV